MIQDLEYKLEMRMIKLQIELANSVYNDIKSGDCENTSDALEAIKHGVVIKETFEQDLITTAHDNTPFHHDKEVR